jgi:hypothetical protein
MDKEDEKRKNEKVNSESKIFAESEFTGVIQLPLLSSIEFFFREKNGLQKPLILCSYHFPSSTGCGLKAMELPAAHP